MVSMLPLVVTISSDRPHESLFPFCIYKETPPSVPRRGQPAHPPIRAFEGGGIYICVYLFVRLCIFLSASTHIEIQKNLYLKTKEFLYFSPGSYGELLPRLRLAPCLIGDVFALDEQTTSSQ